MGSFAQRLRDAMQSAGLKAVDLHERTGISKASISEYLSGNYEPKQKNVYRLAEALHVAPSYLMGLSEQEPPASPAPPAPQKSDGLPELNARDEREIERDLADMMHSVSTAAYEGNTDAQEDVEAFKATLRAAMIQAKRIAKKKYTPRKYQH